MRNVKTQRSKFLKYILSGHSEPEGKYRRKGGGVRKGSLIKTPSKYAGDSFSSSIPSVHCLCRTPTAAVDTNSPAGYTCGTDEETQRGAGTWGCGGTGRGRGSLQGAQPRREQDPAGNWSQ